MSGPPRHERRSAWLSITHPDQTKDHVRLSLALTTVGRSDQNVIESLDSKLSRFHCEIERHKSGYTLRDCNSRNGTLVNGRLVGTTILRDGDRIVAGQTEFVFHYDRPAETPFRSGRQAQPVERRPELRNGSPPRGAGL